MIKAIELENFKAFGERNRIEFAPITLIFGENSAGKSSILQAISLLKQTRECRDSGAIILPRTDGGIVDLGSFRELVFDHDLDRKVTIRVDFATEQSIRGRQPSLSAFREGVSESIGFEVELFRPSDDHEVELSKLSLYSSAVTGSVAQFRPSVVPFTQLRGIGREIRSEKRSGRSTGQAVMKAAKCEFLTSELEVWSEIFERTKRRAGQIAEELQQLQSEFQEVAQQRSLFKETDDERHEWLAHSAEAIRFYSSEFTVDQFIERMVRAEVETIIGLDGFVPVPLQKRELARPPEFETFRRYGPTRIRMRDLTFDLMSFAVDCGRGLDTALEDVYPMGPYRRPPARWYSLSGTSPLNVGHQGDLLPNLLFRRPEIVDETNKWLERLGIGYQLSVRSVGDRSRDLFEVRLKDKRRATPVDVALSDVGFGISQLLPFVVQCLAGQRQTITIEQPEVHIHPRLQADLGDLLAEAIQKPQGHRFIIETHSEHLVLRMQRLVRQGQLIPEDVSILFVSRGPKGSRVERLHLDKDGDFIDEWPGGFFPERLRELM